MNIKLTESICSDLSPRPFPYEMAKMLQVHQHPPFLYGGLGGERWERWERWKAGKVVAEDKKRGLDFCNNKSIAPL